MLSKNQIVQPINYNDKYLNHIFIIKLKKYVIIKLKNMYSGSKFKCYLIPMQKENTNVANTNIGEYVDWILGYANIISIGFWGIFYVILVDCCGNINGFIYVIRKYMILLEEVSMIVQRIFTFLAILYRLTLSYGLWVRPNTICDFLWIIVLSQPTFKDDNNNLSSM
jgi:hypothetical protein